MATKYRLLDRYLGVCHPRQWSGILIEIWLSSAYSWHCYYSCILGSIDHILHIVLMRSKWNGGSWDPTAERRTDNMDEPRKSSPNLRSCCIKQSNLILTIVPGLKHPLTGNTDSAISNIQAMGKSKFPSYFARLITRVGMVRDMEQK